MRSPFKSTFLPRPTGTRRFSCIVAMAFNKRSRSIFNFAGCQFSRASVTIASSEISAPSSKRLFQAWRRRWRRSQPGSCPWGASGQRSDRPPRCVGQGAPALSPRRRRISPRLAKPVASIGSLHAKVAGLVGAVIPSFQPWVVVRSRRVLHGQLDPAPHRRRPPPCARSSRPSRGRRLFCCP